MTYSDGTLLVRLLMIYGHCRPWKHLSPTCLRSPSNMPQKPVHRRVEVAAL